MSHFLDRVQYLFNLAQDGPSRHYAAATGATEKEIFEVEQILGYPFPPSYRLFLNAFNGATLYAIDCLDGFQLLGLEDIRMCVDRVAKAYAEDWTPSRFLFCKIVGEGNYLAFDAAQPLSNGEYPVLDAFHEFLPCQWPIISSDFISWINRLIDSEGTKFWLSMP